MTYLVEVCDPGSMYDMVELSQVRGVEPGAKVELLVRPTESIDDCKVQISTPSRADGSHEEVLWRVYYDSERKGHIISLAVPPSAKPSNFCHFRIFFSLLAVNT